MERNMRKKKTKRKKGKKGKKKKKRKRRVCLNIMFTWSCLCVAACCSLH